MTTKKTPDGTGSCCRREFLLGAAGVATATLSGCATEPEIIPEDPASDATGEYITTLSRSARDAMSPDDALNNLMAGNQRYVNDTMRKHNYLQQKRATAIGQFPSTAIVSCIDSRAAAEILFDATLGEAFNARVAGNVSNPDILGSLEYACAVAGAKLVMVLGHTDCGAVKGAIDQVERGAVRSLDLGNLSALVEKILPAVEMTTYAGERLSSNADFVDKVAVTNVRNTLTAIRANSRALSMLEHQGRIRIVGAMYRLDGGTVELVS